jgi:hypothetical protein
MQGVFGREGRVSQLGRGWGQAWSERNRKWRKANFRALVHCPPLYRPRFLGHRNAGNGSDEASSHAACSAVRARRASTGVRCWCLVTSQVAL